MRIFLASVVGSLLLLAPSARADEAMSSCAPDDGGNGILSALHHDLFVIGAHVLNVVDPSPAYPRDAASREKELARIRKEVAKKKLVERDGKVLASLRATGVDDVDLFHGSHVILQDAGAQYEAWTKLSPRARTSSHYPGVAAQQYEFATPYGVILFGKTGDGDTWFQMESHPDESGINYILHRLDYVKHVGYGFVNVGPMGMSPHSEKRADPILVSR